MIHVYTGTSSPVNSFGRITHGLLECFRRLGHEVLLSTDENLEYDVAVTNPNTKVKSKYLLTFWETTKLRSFDIENLKAQPDRKVIVTCDFTVDAFAAAGIKTEKIKLSSEHSPLPLPKFNPFVFYTIYQDLGYWQRKRTHDILAAFLEAFPTQDDVRLVIKQGPTCAKLESSDVRVKTIKVLLDDISFIHEEGHVCVSACGAEGWGYPHHDAIAFGRPVICPKIGGPVEFLDDSCAWLLPVTMVKAPNGFYCSSGEVGRLNVTELADAMYYAYSNRVEVMEKSTAAFVRARSFTLDQMLVSVKSAFNL